MLHVLYYAVGVPALTRARCTWHDLILPKPSVKVRLLVLIYILAISSVIAAGVALIRAFVLQRRLTSLTQSYWELRYDFGRLRARIAKALKDAVLPRK